MSDALISEQQRIPVVPEAIRSFETAQEWALKSILMIEDEETKARGVTRKIESWNVMTLPDTKSGERDTLMYVFNFADSLGFSIIAADASIQPILAVTESGHYVAGEPTGNDAFDAYMNGLAERLLTRFDGDLYSWYDYVYEGEVVDCSVGVMWGQSNIYGQYCPNGISGCVATAMAQIMAYHQSPSAFYATTAMGNDYPFLSLVQLNWSGMKSHGINHTDTRPCNQYHNQIGALLREIGHRLNTIYYTNPDVSVAYDSNVPGVFSNLGYTTSQVISYTLYDAKTAIKYCGPIYMRGQTSSSGIGHAWVVDGYKDYVYSYCKFERAVNNGEPPVITQQTILSEEHSFHINWGLDGDCNGYFSFGVFDMDNADSYDGSHNTTGNNYAYGLLMVVVY